MSVCNFSLSLCVLNQWALDFTGNTERIIRSIKLAKRSNARYRLGPELELSGYGCEDHFHELDTYTHCWQCLSKILNETNVNTELQDIVCDIGMPVLYNGVAYNCRIILLNGQILLIRPKLVLADGGLHRETRWFTAWPHYCHIVEFTLPPIVQKVTRNSQKTTVFGDAILKFNGFDIFDNVSVGLETCEELWIGSPPHINMFASSVDVVLNASASHHELGKLNRRIELVKMASRSNGGGLYAYTNLRGCDSERICYDGCAIAAVFGQLICLTKQFGLGDLLLETITVDLNLIRSKRIADRCFGRAASAASVGASNIGSPKYPVVKVDFNICHPVDWLKITIQRPITPNLPMPEQEISEGPALWLWDMLRRSKSSGYFLCLSGGLDSASVACIVFSLCIQVYEAIKQGIEPVLKDCRTILGENEQYFPKNARELCSRLFTTCYLSTNNSSVLTRSRAHRLAQAIGSNHIEVDITSVVSEFVTMATKSLNLSQSPRFLIHGGTNLENLALQNVQARSRMVSAYLLAQLLPCQKSLPSGLLVLGSGNLDESLRGYLTKYDCSSADLNPIGSISKLDLRRFLIYCTTHFSRFIDETNGKQLSEVLKDILSAPPTAELIPLESNGQIQQSDESEMGLTYKELNTFGKLRKASNCGPYSMLLSLLDGEWEQIKDSLPKDCLTNDNNPTIKMGNYLCDKVKLFFRFYAINRHKTTVLPPAYHTEAYSADDNRYDLRPFLYPADWTHQFECLNELVIKWEQSFS